MEAIRTINSDAAAPARSRFPTSIQMKTTTTASRVVRERVSTVARPSSASTVLRKRGADAHECQRTEDGKHQTGNVWVVEQPGQSTLVARRAETCERSDQAAHRAEGDTCKQSRQRGAEGNPPLANPTTTATNTATCTRRLVAPRVNNWLSTVDSTSIDSSDQSAAVSHQGAVSKRPRG